MQRRLALKFKVIIALLVTGMLMVPGVDSFAKQEMPQNAATLDSKYLKPHEDDLLVLEVRLEKKSTGHGLIAYQHGDKFLVPLGELCSILELAIMVDPHAGNAVGWVIDEDRTFDLSLANQLITISGEPFPFDPSLIARDEHDIFIESALLTKWLPVDVEINLPRMNVQITPREVLPFQSRLKRDEQRSFWLAGQKTTAMKYPLQAAPYRLWSYPLVDATMGFLSGRQTSSRRLSLQSSADFGGLSTNLFLSYLGTNDHEQTVARLKAGRWNPEGKLLGPASATRYELGDLYISRVPLITASKNGLGAMISNQSLTRSREFDTTEIQGDAPHGWEAELYINGSLYDFQTVGETGQYYFTDVPLSVGNNIFRTVLYGPRGEKREIVKNANISREMSDVGDLKYKAIIVKEGAGVLVKPPTYSSKENLAWSQQLELSYAFHPRHALVANFSRLKVDGLQEFFSSLTSHNSLGRVYLESIFAKSMRGGSAFSLAARSKILGQNLFALYNVNDNYRAESLYGNSIVTRKSILRSSGTIGNWGRQKVVYNLSGSNHKYDASSLDNENEIKLNIGTSVDRFLLSHNFRYRMRDYGDRVAEEMLGSQLVRTQLGSLSLRADLNYELSPSRLRSVGGSINWFHANRVQFSSRASLFFKERYGNDNMSSDLTLFFDKFSVGANYSYFKNGGSAFGLTVGTSLTKDNRSSCYTVQHRRFATRSVASVRAFVDLNANGVFDTGDDPLPDVGFQNLTAWRKIRTNDDGVALLTGILVHRSQLIELDLSTVDDPFLVPLSKGVNVVGHPGSFVDVEFPFSYMGEMEGLIVDAGAVDAPIRHVGLEILDGEGNRVMSTVGEFDGYYYFTKIMPGDYLLGVIPGTVNSFRFEIPAPVKFSVPAEGGYIAGPDIVLQRKISTPVIAGLEVDADEPEIVVPLVVAEADNIEDSAIAETEIVKATIKPVVVAGLDSDEFDTMPAEKLVVNAVGPVTGNVAEERQALLARMAEMAELSVPLGPMDFDEDLTLSLIFEVLHRNSLWPDEPAQ